MTDVIVTKPIKVKELVAILQEEFLPNDIVTTGLWIKKK
jgi:hypothetical protein